MNSNQAEINAWALDYLINRGEVIMENRQPKGFEVPNYGLPALPPGGPLPVDEGHDDQPHAVAPLDAPVVDVHGADDGHGHGDGHGH